MSLTKEIIEHERQQVQSGLLRDIHLHKEGTFLRAYNWSAWLCCRYLHFPQVFNPSNILLE
jgi:hypothetical protein